MKKQELITKPQQNPVGMKITSGTKAGIVDMCMSKENCQGGIVAYTSSCPHCVDAGGSSILTDTGYCFNCNS